ncbi:DUF929 family protein [Acidihalobacter ferrooxydans]|uniref:DUF929 domain-containing protein n=1 Tax=Acidihalobacter ferrooxydans TaxID=1765967 RepID=A0A1P8UF12_9GAMM|nr:DUF929 family protein [Acidihalobacter ferrooxydans]APZ42378.1 hypothetical protein BW247_04125 [Acidihalobacter ferrooxydans]
MYKRLIRILTTTAGALALGLLTACSQADTQINQPVSSTVMQKLEAASKASLQLGQAPLFTSLQAIKGANAGPGSKPGVLYVGADFCPFCAALRWPLIISLLHFGTLDGLHTMRSSSTDVYPDTTTFNFVKAHYKSAYIHFQAVETATRDGKPLEPLTGQAAKLFKKYDAPPYTSQAGGIPFLYIGGHWLLLGSPITPKDFGTKDWTQLATELADPKSKLARAVLPQANLITAAICQSTGGKPQSVCKAPGIVAAAALLPPR